jgi:hypothetical protein
VIGKTLESVPGFSWSAIVLLAIGGTMLAVAGYVGSRHVALAAVPFLCVGAGCWWSSPRPFRAKVTDIGLDLESPPGVLRYADIEMVQSERDDARERCDKICVFHAHGALQLPANIDVDREDLHAFLMSRLERDRQWTGPECLASFLTEQRAAFGNDRVWAYRARAALQAPRSRRRIRAVLLAMMVTGLIWSIAGAMLREGGWFGAGFGGVMLFGLFLLATWVQPRAVAGIKNWRQAGLVISPLGIALAQGDIQGQLRWNELRDLRLKNGRGSFLLSSHYAVKGIRLKLDGAEVIIADIYNAPLTTIHQQIVRYWRGPV